MSKQLAGYDMASVTELVQHCTLY